MSSVMALKTDIVVIYMLCCYCAVMSRPSPSNSGGGVNSANWNRSYDLPAEFLNPQNNARAEVGEDPLVWDYKVESYARWWAEQRRGDCELMHSHGPYGENIFWGGGRDWTPLDAATDWVEEKKYYTYETNSCDVNEMCGHYTQIVWKDTRRLGCARVVCDSGDVFMTCNYDPPGNYIGEKPY